MLTKNIQIIQEINLKVDMDNRDTEAFSHPKYYIEGKNDER